MWQFYYICEFLLSDISKLSDQQYRVFPSRHIFDPAMLSLAFLDVLTGLIATPIVTLVYYYSRESDKKFFSDIFQHIFHYLPKMRVGGVEIR